MAKSIINHQSSIINKESRPNPRPAPSHASLTYVVSRASRPRVPRASCPRLSTRPLSSVPAPLAHPAQITTQSHPHSAKQTQFSKRRKQHNPFYRKDLRKTMPPPRSKKQTQSNPTCRGEAPGEAGSPRAQDDIRHTKYEIRLPRGGDTKPFPRPQKGIFYLKQQAQYCTIILIQEGVMNAPFMPAGPSSL